MPSVSPNPTASSRNRWIRLGLQTAFGLALLWLCVRTVSLTDVVAARRGLLGATALAVGLLGAVLGTALLGPRVARSSLARRVLPARISSALAGQAFAFRAGARGLWTPALAARLAGLTALALLLDAFNFTLLFAAVGVDIPTWKAMAAYPALLLSFAVPAGPGYLGNLEVAGSLVLGGGLGLAPAVAAGAIVVYHAVTAAYALVLGLLGFLLVGGRRQALAGAPRRVAVFHCGFTYSGGGERIVIEEVLGLRRRGYQVDCYAPTVDASRCYPDLLDDLRVRTFLPQLPRWFPFREAVQMAATSLLMPLYAWRFRGVDAIVGCNQPSAWIAWWAARLMDVPYVVYLNQPNRLVYPRNIDRQTGWVPNADYRLHTASLKSLVTELGLEDAVLFLGPITEEELQSLYEGAAVYVYPAPEEDFGMGVIEAMAKGAPVVAWDQAGPTVTVGPGTGHLAEPLDVEDYAAGIASLLDSRAENQAAGERALEWARRFDWERHIDTMERVVLDVAREHEQSAAEAATA